MIQFKIVFNLCRIYVVLNKNVIQQCLWQTNIDKDDNNSASPFGVNEQIWQKKKLQSENEEKKT